MGKKNNPAQDVINTAKTAYGPTTSPSTEESATKGLAGDVGGVYRNAAAQSMGDYGSLMSGYKNMAQTGGYSDADIQNLRTRAMQPIKSSYENTMMDLNRAKELGGGGAGAPNYIAAVSKATRQLPQQMSDAMTGVNVGIKQNQIQNQMAGMAGGSSLYGSTPGLASSFANQFGNLEGLGNQMQLGRENYGLGLMNAQLGGYGVNQGAQGQSPWQTGLGMAATGLGAIFSDKNMKKDIKDVGDKPFTEGLKKLSLKTWKYKGDNTTHVGPMAQDFKKVFKVGDGKTIHPADVFGVLLGAGKEAYA